MGRGADQFTQGTVGAAVPASGGGTVGARLVLGWAGLGWAGAAAPEEDPDDEAPPVGDDPDDEGLEADEPEMVSEI
jgi:hypothetical protein